MAFHPEISTWRCCSLFPTSGIGQITSRAPALALPRNLGKIVKYFPFAGLPTQSAMVVLPIFPPAEFSFNRFEDNIKLLVQTFQL